MKYCLYLACLLVVLIACNKDKFNTKPQLEVKSMTSKNIPVNGSFHVVFTYTDKEGDLNDTLFYKKKRLNVRTTAEKIDTLRYIIPEFPKAIKGDLDVLLPYNDLQAAVTPLNVPGTNPPKKESDTLNLLFAIKDRAGHTSDTLTIPGVVVQRN